MCIFLFPRIRQFGNRRVNGCFFLGGSLQSNSRSQVSSYWPPGGYLTRVCSFPFKNSSLRASCCRQMFFFFQTDIIRVAAEKNLGFPYDIRTFILFPTLEASETQSRRTRKESVPSIPFYYPFQPLLSMLANAVGSRISYALLLPVNLL